ncbi:unnamed protein product [Adineta ricciae]|uniref:Uncharacterized protein n=1 Tax=Adineta ricciae TaxID=249248 RepID=A0A815EI94_ADIRI|nr:unnamed protein product [Adineta ricciae]
MLKQFLSCRRICCNRKARIFHPPTNTQFNHEITTNSHSPDKISNDIAVQYLAAINQYRFQLGFSALELSDELTNRALQRAMELSMRDQLETSDPSILIFHNEPIGETYSEFLIFIVFYVLCRVLACQSPVATSHCISLQNAIFVGTVFI